MRIMTTIAAAIALGGTAMAADPSEPVIADTDTLETVVVTATRTPKLLMNTPVQTRVLTQADIRRSGKADIGQLMEQQLPGVEFSLGMAQNAQINFSGFGGGGILFLLDGERLAGETLDNPDYSRLNLQNVQRVEIVKGAASSLYGSNATGGVVNIISAKPKKGFHLALDANYGSHNLQRYGAIGSYSKGRVANTIDARYDGESEIRLPSRGDFSRIYATHSWNVRDRATIDLGGDATITARAGWFFRQRNSSVVSNERFRDWSAGLLGRWDGFRLSYAFDCYDKSDVEIGGPETRDYRNRQNSLHLQYSHDFGDIGTLTAGGDWLDDYLLSYEFGSDAYSQTNLDAFAQWDWEPVRDIWIVPGLRYDHFSASEANRVSPKLSFLWRAGRCALRVNYAAGFRAPTLKELYMDFDMMGAFHIYGNQDLKSETSQNFTVSSEWTRGGTNVTVSAFHNLISDRISYLWNEQLQGQQYINLRRMRVYGMDLSGSVALNFGMTLHGSYVFTSEHYTKGNLRANPTRPHALTARADYSHDWKRDWRLTASLNYKWMSAVTGDVVSFFSDEAVRTQRYPGYSMLNLTLSQSLGSRFDLQIGIDNLLDYVPDYYYYNSPLTTGTSFRVGLTYTF